jgi:D-sedoheptulose 7-phosphate isomerase
MKEKYDQYIHNYLDEVTEIANKISRDSIVNFANEIKNLKDSQGRLFIFGVGGSAANSSHAVNDFRKILNIETYSPLDNVSELTARINDESWDVSLINWLKVSKLNKSDVVMIFSVGGGSDTTSKNLVEVMKYAKLNGSKILSVVSRDGGYAKKLSDVCVLIPVLSANTITPHAEEWQAVVWHMIVSCISNVGE